MNRSFMMEKLLLILLVTGGVVQTQDNVVVPQGIGSVNGSDVNMGCTSPLVDSGGVMVCSSDCSTLLLDGISPTIDTSTSDWASQLVTVRPTEYTENIPFPHVLLTFGFDTAVSVTGIELDMFICPEWNIRAPDINVFADEESNLVFNGSSGLPFEKSSPDQSSCDSLSTVNISLIRFAGSPYRTWHIVVNGFPEDIGWVHVGEVRFLGADVMPKCSSVAPSTMTPPMTTTTGVTTTFPPLSSSLTTTQLTQTTSHTLTPTPISISRPSSQPTSPSQQSAGGPLVIVLVVVIVGVIVVVIVLALLIFCVVRRRSCSAKPLPAIELKEQQKYTTHDPQRNPVSATNPISFDDHSRYYCPELPVDTDAGYDVIKKELMQRAQEALYDKVAKDATPALPPPPPPPPPASTQTATYDDDDTGLYEIVRTSSAPVRTSVQQQREAQSTPDSTPDLSGRVYSVVQKKKAPAVPKKSVDLEEYLAVRSGFNENIYSESINPSDFIKANSQQAEVGETGDDPLIYAPIYPAPTALPESFEQPVELTIDSIAEKRPLRIGQFGEVVKASTKGLSLKDMHLSKTDDNKEISITVAVKKLKPHPTPTQQRAFDVEAKFMSRLRHPNVIRLLGLCYQEPAFIMMEYMREGDLSQFLQKYSDIVPLPATDAQIAASTLVYMAYQIASGMKQLAALNFVHRDLSTRNCLVGENYTVKIADLGVSRNIYQSHYFRVQGYILLPIRWMATECFNGKFSEKSDVWAFGVTMWEMFTLAKDVPYPHLSDEEVIHNALKREYRLFPSRAAACPEPVYEIMEKCWAVDLNKRATLKQLHEMLQQTSL